MEIKSFIENVAEQFDLIDIAEFSAETKFKELEDWTSLVALSIILMVDEEYDVTIGAEDIKGSVTIQDLFNRVSTK